MKNNNKRSPVSAVCSALGTLILILMIAVCIPLTLPKVMGYQMYTVVSGSMEPEIPIGSLVCIKEMDPSEVETNDIIAFYGARNSDVVITHRVVENNHFMGQMTTKGDANENNDLNPLEYEDFIGKMEKSIPYMGVVAQIFTSFEGKIAAAGFIGIALGLHAVSILFDEKKNQ